MWGHQVREEAKFGNWQLFALSFHVGFFNQAALGFLKLLRVNKLLIISRLSPYRTFSL